MFRLGSRRITRSVDKQGGDSVDVSEIDGVRSLHLGSSTIQSSMRVKTPYDLELTYTRGMMCYLLFQPQAQKLLVIGLGGGSIPKFVWYYLPEEVKVTAVEINPHVIEVARSHFMLPEDDARLRVVEGDGAAYIREHPATTDVLMLDAFASSGVAPELCSQDFYDSCASALSADGVMLVNLWGSDRNFDLYMQRIELSFDNRVLVMPTGRPGNIVVFAFKRAPPDLRWETLRERARLLEHKYKIEFPEFVGRLRNSNLHSTHRLML
jgi:spermidine synthase